MEQQPATNLQDDEQALASTPSGWTSEKLDRLVKAAKNHFDNRKAFDKKFRDSYFNKKEVDSEGATVNFTYATICLMRAVLYSISPKLVVEPRESSGSGQEFFQALMQSGLLPDGDPQTARRMYADIAEEVEQFAFDHSGAFEHVGQAVLEVLLTGMAITKHSFDELLGIERTDCLMRHEVYFDPEARFKLDQCRYVVHSHSMPVAAARRFLLNKWVGLRQMMQANGMNPQNEDNPLFVDPTWSPLQLEANETLAEATGDQSNTSSDGKDWFRFYEIWSNDEGERWVWFCVDTGPQDKKILFRQPWPFTLQAREYPFSILVFNRTGKILNDAFSEQHVVAGLRKVYQRWADFLRRLTERSIGKVLLVDESKIDSAKQEKIKDGTQELQIIGIDSPAGGDVSKALYVANLNQGDDKLLELHQIVKAWIDEILGVDELLRGADSQGTMTATEAKVRDDMLRVRQSERQGVFDDFLSDIFAKRLCIARQKTQPDTIFKIAGPEAALAWQLNASHPDDFCMEYDITVEAGSTAQRHKEEMIRNFDSVIQKFAAANQLATQMGQPPPFDVIETIKAQAGVIMENVSRYETKLAPQPMAPQMPMQPQIGQESPSPPGAAASPPAVAPPVPSSKQAPVQQEMSFA